MSNEFDVLSDGSTSGDYRTTEALVRALGSFPSTLSLDAYIATANILVDDVEATGATCLTAARLELIERWLSAHFAAVNAPKVTSKSIAGASSSFEGAASGQGLSLTRFGQQAMALDCSGYLRNLDKPKPKMTWLGTIPT